MTNQESSRRLLDTHEAAPRLGCASNTLRISRCTGVLFGRPAPKFIKLGRTVRYSAAELDAWLAEVVGQEVGS